MRNRTEEKITVIECSWFPDALKRPQIYKKRQIRIYYILNKKVLAKYCKNGSKFREVC